MQNPDKILQHFMAQYSKCGFRISTEDRNDAETLIHLARNDLDSCINEYRLSRYSKSVFWLQQASEKTFKSLLRLTGQATQRDLKNMSHSSGKMASQILTKAKPLLAIVDYFDAKSTPLERWIHGGHRTAIATRDEIMNTLEITEGNSKSFLTNVENTLRKATAVRRKRAAAESAFRLIRILAETVPIYTIYVFTSLHESPSRYSGAIKPDEYRPGLGIVDATPELIPRLERAILAVETYLKSQS